MPSTENSRHFSSSSRAPSISSRSSILRSAFGRVEQRERRERVGALLALGRQLAPARAAAAARGVGTAGFLIAGGGVGLDDAALSAAAAAPTIAAVRDGFVGGSSGGVSRPRPRLRVGGARATATSAVSSFGAGRDRRPVLRRLLVEMLLQHLLALLLALLFFAAGADRRRAAPPTASTTSRRSRRTAGRTRTASRG